MTILLCLIVYNVTSVKKTKKLLKAAKKEQKMVSFGAAVKMIFTKMFDYKSRSSLSEYWWGLLFFVLVILFLGIIAAFVLGPTHPVLTSNTLIGVLTLLFFTLSVRRMRDIGLHPIFVILIFAVELFSNVMADLGVAFGMTYTIVYNVLSLGSFFLFLTASTPKKNKYGEVPNLKRAKK